MLYPIFIEKDPDSDYGVTVPDIPGCFSAGSTYEEALYMAQDAIQGHLELLAEKGGGRFPWVARLRYLKEKQLMVKVSGHSLI